LEPPESTPLAPSPTVYPLEPGKLPYEGHHSIAMSGVSNGARYAGHYDGVPRVPGGQEIEVTSRLDREAIDATHATGRRQFRKGVVNPQCSKRRVLHNEERLHLRGLEPKFAKLSPLIQGAIHLRKGR